MDDGYRSVNSLTSDSSVVWVFEPSPPLSPPGEEPNSPGETLDSPDDTSQHVRDVITIAPQTYELFPFVDPFEDLELLLPPHFPYLPAPPGFAPIDRPGEIPAPAGMAARYWSSFIRPAPPSQLSRKLPGWAAVDRDQTSSVISPIAHIPSTESRDIPTTDSMASVTADDRLLASLLTQSSFRSMSHNSVTSESTFYNVMDGWAGPTPAGCSVLILGWRLKREGPFVAPMPHPRIGDSSCGCAFHCTTYRNSDFAQPSGKYSLPLHHPRFLEWVGAPESARLLDMGPGAWTRSLSRTQSVDAACQFHQDACLMTSNLNILDQYVLCLQGTGMKLLELTRRSVASGSPCVNAYRGHGPLAPFLGLCGMYVISFLF